MPHDKESINIRILGSLNEVTAAQWDECAGKTNPFVSHAFLKTLEDSGTVHRDTGWLAQHIVIENQTNLVAVVPCYLKNHSYGEYVFDWAWANAYEKAGGHYYPKLQVAVPFSPVTGPRLLVREDQNKEKTQKLLTGVLLKLADEHNVSSLHLTFTEKQEWEELGKLGLLQRQGQQFHWKNQNYSNFDEFLDSLNARKRKMIRKERAIANTNVDVRILTGEQIKSQHMDIFYNFYLNTIDSKWANAYLNNDFFHLLREKMSKDLVMVMAKHDNSYVAGALNLRGPNTLWGRNWGCAKRFKMLYFETCFYRSIEFAIENQISTVEAGAQGPHKISRGYLPNPTYSVHWIKDPGFRQAVSDFLNTERIGVENEMETLGNLSPFKISRDPL